ncbi:DUF6506 family protein [Nonomuraea longicatena]|uniref:Uncharacterized protein n=1 Tax=Nonomuraea longicatena TaxID=83682 RepID=A0ABN1NQ29_9ACTN
MDHVIIYETVDADPATDLLTVENEHGRTRVRAVGEPAEALELAARLADEGVDEITLCGAIGALWHGPVNARLKDRVRVNGIYYGFESLTSVADYKARYEAGEVLAEVFLIVHEGAAPEQVLLTRPDGGTTTLATVPDLAGAVRLAGEMAADLDLIELYGVSGPESAEPVIRAVDAEVPVGFVV